MTIGPLGLAPRAAPSCMFVSIEVHEFIRQYSHFRLDHLMDQFVLAFGNLNHLLDQTGANLVLQLGYAGTVSECDTRRLM
jgi:hypothetical protein